VVQALMKITPANPRVDFPHLFLVDAKGSIREDWGWAKDQAALSSEALFATLDKYLAAPAAAAPKASAPKPSAK
jgi:hypothetical protein